MLFFRARIWECSWEMLVNIGYNIGYAGGHAMLYYPVFWEDY